MTATFSRKTDAVAWIQEEERKVRLGIHSTPAETTRRTFDEAVARYKLENGRTSRQLYQPKVWQQHFGPMYLSMINEIAINDICAKMEA